MKESMMIGRALHLLRAHAGLTQKELAEILQLPQSTISAFESGKRLPSLDALQAYSEKLNISVSNLVFFAEHLAGQPFSRGKLFIAEKTLSLLERLVGQKTIRS